AIRKAVVEALEARVKELEARLAGQGQPGTCDHEQAIDELKRKHAGEIGRLTAELTQLKGEAKAKEYARADDLPRGPMSPHHLRILVQYLQDAANNLEKYEQSQERLHTRIQELEQANAAMQKRWDDTCEFSDTQLQGIQKRQARIEELEQQLEGSQKRNKAL